METGYRHGAYGEVAESAVSGTSTATTATLVVGTAPVHLIRNYRDAGIINKPVRLSNISAKKIIGYSEDWSSFTLCEVIETFFSNAKGNVGPVYVINVLNPELHRKVDKTTKKITFVNGRATMKSDRIILDTFAMEDKVLDVDYDIQYDFCTGNLIVTSLDKDERLKGEISISYYEADPSAVTAGDVIGTISEEGVYTGLQAGQRLYPDANVVTNLVAAPGWAEIPAVYEAMTEYAQKINGHWYAFTYADIPIKEADTIDKAIDWKADNGYDSVYSKVFWPSAKISSGKACHLSTLALVETMRADMEHDGIPMETCSNKSVPVMAQYFGEEAVNQGFDQQMANKLNARGITTVVSLGGMFVLWGGHTAAFASGEDGNVKPDIDKLAIFDTNVRMQEHILNRFQVMHGTEVDKPLEPNDRDSIIEQEQQYLDGLVSRGALVGNPAVEFLECGNTESDIMNGNFVWDFRSTPTPQAKSMTARVAYTDEGYKAYFEEVEGNG